MVNNYPGTLTIKSLKADYVHPLPNKIRIEAGIKGSWVSNKNDLKFQNIVNDVGILNTALSNNFIYEENVYGFYINSSKEFKKFSLQIGLRGEETHTSSFQVTDNKKIETNYFQLFPTLFFNYSISDNNQLGCSFARRINRPTYQRLNPYKKIYDPLNYEEGNPYLKPSFSNEAEIDYSFKNKIFISLFYGYEDRAATNIILQDEITKTTITTFGNLAIAQDAGITFTYSDQVISWFNTNNFVGLFINKFQGPYLTGYLDIVKSTFNFNSTNSFTISKTFKAELSINYLSGQQQGLLNIDNIGLQINPGVQKTVFNKRGNIKLSIVDLLNARKWNYSTVFQNIDTRYESRRDNRRLSLSFNWKFGKQTVKQERKRKTGVDDEKSRIE